MRIIVFVLFFVCWGAFIQDAAAQPMFRRGDANQDGGVDISDVVFMLEALIPGTFEGPFVITCEDAADVNDDGQVNIADPINLLYVLGVPPTPPPPPPYLFCGEDPTDDALGCDAADACP